MKPLSKRKQCALSQVIPNSIKLVTYLGVTAAIGAILASCVPMETTNLGTLKNKVTDVKESIGEVAARLGIQKREIGELTEVVGRNHISRRELHDRWNYVRNNLSDMVKYIDTLKTVSGKLSTMEEQVLTLWSSVIVQKVTLERLVADYNLLIETEIKHCDEMKNALNEIKYMVVANTIALKYANNMIEQDLELSFQDMPDTNFDTLTMLELQQQNVVMGVEIKNALKLMKKDVLVPNIRKKRDATEKSSKISNEPTCPVRSYLGQKDSSACCSLGTGSVLGP